jgi:hypothetical protein
VQKALDNLSDDMKGRLAGQTEHGIFKGKFIDYGKLNEMTDQQKNEFAIFMFSDK